MASVYRITKKYKNGKLLSESHAAAAKKQAEEKKAPRVAAPSEYPLFFETDSFPAAKAKFLEEEQKKRLSEQKPDQAPRPTAPEKEIPFEKAFEEARAAAEAEAKAAEAEAAEAETETAEAETAEAEVEAAPEAEEFPPVPAPDEEDKPEKTLEFLTGEDGAAPKEPGAEETAVFELPEETKAEQTAVFELPGEAPAEDAARAAAEKDAARREGLAKLFAEGEKDGTENKIGFGGAPDLGRIEEVYSAGKGALNQKTAKKDYDEVTNLLMEVFGNDDKKKKKKKNEPEPSLSKTQLSEIFEPGSTSEVPVDETGKVQNVVDETESTREFEPAAIEEALDAIVPEKEEKAPEPEPELNDEVKMDADSPYGAVFDDTNEYVQEKKEGLPEEFTKPEQADEFSEHLRAGTFRSLVTSFWSFLLAALLFLWESPAVNSLLPEFLQPGQIPYIYQLLDLQLVFLSALLILPSLGDGVKALFSGKANRNSLTFTVMLVAALHPVARCVSLALGAEITHENGYVFLGGIAGIFAFLTCVANFLDNKRLYRTFRVAASKKTKLVAERVASDSAEADFFRDNQEEADPSGKNLFTIKKADFVENFFRKTRESAPGTAYGFLILLSLLLSAGFTAFCYWMPDASYWETVSKWTLIERFVTASMMTLPLSGLFAVTLPFTHLSRKAEKRESAIISAAAAESYARADLVSFTDKEIFPPRSVKLTTIRTYGDTRIDSAILYAAMIFQKLGGPLSLVFKKTLSGVVTEIKEDFDFLEITADGMCAKIDGKEVFVGNKDYLLSYDFGYTKDESDEAFERRAGKIMYMVIGKTLAAKFYIRYSISKRFTKTLNALYKAGIYAAVKTCDPNIDSDLFKALMRNRRFPAGIVKTTDAMKDAPAQPASDSGIVCTSTISNMLHTFVLSEKLLHLIRLNTVVKILASLAGAGVLMGLYFFGDQMAGVDRVTPLFIALYHLLWILPGAIPSLTE